MHRSILSYYHLLLIYNSIYQFHIDNEQTRNGCFVPDTILTIHKIIWIKFIHPLPKIPTSKSKRINSIESNRGNFSLFNHEFTEKLTNAYSPLPNPTIISLSSPRTRCGPRLFSPLENRSLVAGNGACIVFTVAKIEISPVKMRKAARRAPVPIDLKRNQGRPPV